MTFFVMMLLAFDTFYFCLYLFYVNDYWFVFDCVMLHRCICIYIGLKK